MEHDADPAPAPAPAITSLQPADDDWAARDDLEEAPAKPHPHSAARDDDDAREAPRARAAQGTMPLRLDSCSAPFAPSRACWILPFDRSSPGADRICV